MFVFRSPQDRLEEILSPDLSSRVLDPDFRARFLYGTQPEAGQIAALKQRLYRVADQQLERFISDKRFIPRFLLAALAFVGVYFFLSFVIRDPFPLVDEVVGGILAAVLVWFLVSRRDRNSLLAAEMGKETRQRLDSIEFVPSPSILQLEGFIEAMEARGDIPLTEVLEGLEGILDTMDEANRQALLEGAALGFRLRLPSRRTLARRTQAGLGLDTWKLWCTSKGQSPWIACLALVYRGDW